MKTFFIGKLVLILSILFFLPVYSSYADTVIYKEGSVIEGKIIGQTPLEVIIETASGEVLRIQKKVILKLRYGNQTKPTLEKQSSNQSRSEVINLPTNTQKNVVESKSNSSSTEPIITTNTYYQILKDSKSYLIRLQGENFQSIKKVLLDNQEKEIDQQIYNLQAKSVEFSINSSALDLGFYDLVLESKTGTKIRREYFVEVKEP
jgi:hypothetical protein